MKKQKLIIYWSRRDFRLQDNSALLEATQKANQEKIDFVPLYILDNQILETNSSTNIGYPRRLFLSKALAQFATNFDQMVVVKGDYKIIFETFQDNFDVLVYANEDIEPYSLKRDSEVKNIVSEFQSFTDQITVDRNTVSMSDKPYSVFTPFKKAVWQEFMNAKADAKVTKIPQTSKIDLDSQPLALETLKYKDQTDLEKQIFELVDTQWSFAVGDHKVNLDKILKRPDYKNWYFSESEALEHFDQYLESGKMSAYRKNRDDLGLDTMDEGQTSRMSVALKWGLVSARTLKAKVLNFFETDFDNPMSTSHNEGGLHFLSELVWREFYRYTLFQRPDVLDQEFQSKFQGTIEWVDDKIAFSRFQSWIKGETGYPVVDAAMHQIAQIGWMHNRSRMIVASVLTKNLGVDWRWGQEYFRAVLLDLDEASNNGGWQWAASVGADPKPIRIFNPHLQAQNHDSKSLYQKKWLPDDYSASLDPVIEHKKAREEALERYKLNNAKPRDY